MELKDVLQQISQQSYSAQQPTDLCIGTVTAVNPLEVTISQDMAPLQQQVLYLTANVVERKIPVLSHSHYIPAGTLTHTHGGAVAEDLTGQYQTNNSLLSSGADTSLQTEDIICYENGQPLPIEDGYIILNRALEVGDEVLLLKVQKGQKYIILSRTFPAEGGS